MCLDGDDEHERKQRKRESKFFDGDEEHESKQQKKEMKRTVANPHTHERSDEDSDADKSKAKLVRGGDEVHTKRRRTIAATEPERKQNPLAGHETSKTVAADAKIKPKRDVQCQPHQKQTARNKNLSAEEEEQDEDSRLLEAPEPFYEVSIMPPDLSPHPRAKLQKALEDTAKKLRKHPTLPACPANAHEPWQEALSEVMAVALPRSLRLCQL